MARQHGADAVENGSPEASTQTCRPRCASIVGNAPRTATARPRRAADERPASARWRLPPNTISAPRAARAPHAIRPSIAVLADADDGQPAAALRQSSTAATTITGSACDASSFSAAPRRRGAGAGASPGARDLAVTLSLAGRTAHPAPQPVPVRIGGFGGAEGLADYLAHRNASTR